MGLRSRLEERGRNFNRGVGMLNERARNVRENPRANRVERAAGALATYGVTYYPGRTGQPARREIQRASTQAIDRGGLGTAAGYIGRYGVYSTTGEARLGGALMVAGPVASRGGSVAVRRAVRGLDDTVADGATRGSRAFGDDIAGTSRRSTPSPTRTIDNAPTTPTRRRFPTGRTAAAVGGAALLGYTSYQIGQNSVSAPASDGGSSPPGGGIGPGGSEGGEPGAGFEDPFLGANVGAGYGSDAGEGGDLAALASSGIVAVGIILLLAMGDN